MIQSLEMYSKGNYTEFNYSDTELVCKGENITGCLAASTFTEISVETSPSIFSVKQLNTNLPRLLDPQGKALVSFRNVGKYLTEGTIQQFKKNCVSSETTFRASNLEFELAGEV